MIKRIKNALKDIWANKIRSLLTVLGILIGIASVTMMVSIGGSAQAFINQSITNRLGKNLLIVQPGQGGMGGGISFGVSSALGSLMDADYNATNKALAGTGAYVTRRLMTSLSMNYGRASETALVYIVDPSYFRIVDIALIDGRYPRIGTENTRDVVINEGLSQRLFKFQDPIGKKVTIQGYEFTVIGVVESAAGVAIGDSGEFYLDTVTYRQVFRKPEKVGAVMIAAPENTTINEVKEKVKRAIRIEKGIGNSEKDDFSVTTQEEIIETSDSILGTVTLFITVISAISLVVGGIGVMNIMLVSVKERVKEIGLRKAIGATNQDIQLQILTEAVLFSLIGGILGIFLGSAGALIVQQVGGLPLYISVSAIVTSLGVSSVVGIVFGLYPALQAGRLSPIEALRSN